VLLHERRRNPRPLGRGGCQITNSVVMTECQSKGQWAGSYAPQSNSHLQYSSLVEELLQTLGVHHEQ
jgi:hypothetical protein